MTDLLLVGIFMLFIFGLITADYPQDHERAIRRILFFVGGMCIVIWLTLTILDQHLTRPLQVVVVTPTTESAK